MAAILDGGLRLSNILKAKEDLQKTADQLEIEKQEILSKRIIKLDLDGKTRDEYRELVLKFHEILINLQSQYYDLSEKYERQKYDMMELAERARQIEKGKAKTRKSNVVHTGLGGSVFTKISEYFPQAPGKISLFSRYERVTDRRTLKERRDVFTQVRPQDVSLVPKPKLIKEIIAAKKGRKDFRSRKTQPTE
jgi:hypothetical protein